MLTSQLIANLEKLKAAVGDVPIELWVETQFDDFATEIRTSPPNLLLNTDQIKLRTGGDTIEIVYERNPFNPESHETSEKSV